MNEIECKILVLKHQVPSMSVAELSLKLQRSMSTIYNALQLLKCRGAISKTTLNNKTHYRIADEKYVEEAKKMLVEPQNEAV